MKHFLTLLFCLFAAGHAAAQAPPATPAGAPTVCVPVPQAREIALALARFERLKLAYAEKSRSGFAKDAALYQRQIIITAKDSIAASFERAEAIQNRLLQDANWRATDQKIKARRRGWLALGLGALAVLFAVN